MAMPHLFFNAHLACFDAPIATMWLASIFVYWRAEQEKTLPWALLAGVVFGLTLETKHNAWMLPGVFLPHALLQYGGPTARDGRSGRFSIPASLVSMATSCPEGRPVPNENCDPAQEPAVC